jgi:hypothetical protein
MRLQVVLTDMASRGIGIFRLPFFRSTTVGFIEPPVYPPQSEAVELTTRVSELVGLGNFDRNPSATRAAALPHPRIQLSSSKPHSVTPAKSNVTTAGRCYQFAKRQAPLHELVSGFAKPATMFSTGFFTATQSHRDRSNYTFCSLSLCCELRIFAMNYCWEDFMCI